MTQATNAAGRLRLTTTSHRNAATSNDPVRVAGGTVVDTTLSPRHAPVAIPPIVQRLSDKYHEDRAFFDKSTTFGVNVDCYIMNKFRYGGTMELSQICFGNRFSIILHSIC